MSNTSMEKKWSGERHQFLQIRDELRQRIESGIYAVGSALPTEGSLCKEFKTSRHSIRESLRLLTDVGLIERRQGSGSRVLADTPNQKYVHDMRSLDQLFQYASDTRFVINEIKIAVPERNLSPEVGRSSEEWLLVRGVRLERDEDIPICVSTVLVNKAYASISEELRSGSGAIYRRIEDKFDIQVAQVVQDITITTMPKYGESVLDNAASNVAVQVRRRYLGSDETTILSSINHHPADGFSYTMQLRRE